MRGLVSAAIASALVSLSSTASATFSILAVDLEDGSVGGAVASCVALETIQQVYGAVPGYGAVMTQSYLLPRAHGDALGWLGAGESPKAILEALTQPAYDADFELRQYAVVGAAGDIANFSGHGANSFVGHLAFEVPGARTAERRFVASAQGNFLTGQEVLERARTGFEKDACDLPERLLNALLAAGSAGAGDARCTPNGTPAESALLAVDPPAFPQGTYLALTSQVSAPAADSPLPNLEAQFLSWRAAHPCSGAAGGSASGGSQARASAPAQTGCAIAPGSGASGSEAPGSGAPDFGAPPTGRGPWWLACAALCGWLRRRNGAPHPRTLEPRRCRQGPRPPR